jgi:hypothetical protein
MIITRGDGIAFGQDRRSGYSAAHRAIADDVSMTKDDDVKLQS